MESAATNLLPRGVWPAGYMIDGLEVLLAIDSRGNCLRRVKLAEGVDEEIARAWLEGIIDHYDPAPKRPDLRLVHARQVPRLPSSVFVLLNRPHARRL